jgi:hypothetical protein
VQLCQNLGKISPSQKAKREVLGIFGKIVFKEVKTKKEEKKKKRMNCKGAG